LSLEHEGTTLRHVGPLDSQTRCHTSEVANDQVLTQLPAAHSFLTHPTVHGCV